MTTVITYGTFDLFHVGHLKLLERARQKGDKLIVGVSSDEFNAEKGKRCVVPFVERAEIVGSLKCVDIVIREFSWNQKINDIIKHNVDIFTIGSDWRGEFDYLSEFCRVEYLDRTVGISTTELKQRISSRVLK